MQVCTGQIPWKDFSTMEIMSVVRFGGQRPDTSGVALGPFKDLMLQCWAADPRARPDAAEAMKTISTLLEAEGGDPRGGLEQGLASLPAGFKLGAKAPKVLTATL